MSEEKQCYFCQKEIEGEINYIEWIPLFMRYANVCDKCHEEKEAGDTIENIKIYEKFLGSIGLFNLFGEDKDG